MKKFSDVVSMDRVLLCRRLYKLGCFVYSAFVTFFCFQLFCYPFMEHFPTLAVGGGGCPV
jgi:hypothetical protein